MSNWSIEKRVNACGTCEREFQDGEALYSLLAVGEAGLARADRCAACRSDEELDAALFWWRTHHQESKRKGLQLDLEAIEALFVALGEKTEGPAAERLAQLRYLMCLILLRKRRVKVIKVAREHEGVKGEFFLCKRPRRDELLAVEVFDFDAQKIEELRGDLQRIFEGADPAELAAAGSEPEDALEVDAEDAEAAAEESPVAPGGAVEQPEGGPDSDPRQAD